MVGARFVMAKIVYYRIKIRSSSILFIVSEEKIHLESCMGFLVLCCFANFIVFEI
jgi:hypothetical protein